MSWVSKCCKSRLVTLTFDPSGKKLGYVVDCRKDEVIGTTMGHIRFFVGGGGSENSPSSGEGTLD